MKAPSLFDEILEILAEATLADDQDQGLTGQEVMDRLEVRRQSREPVPTRPTKVPYLRVVL